MKSFRLWLEPDTEFPEFQRLHWEMIDGSLEDVLMQGIHPWSTEENHLMLCEVFMSRFNDPALRISSLEPFGYSWDMMISMGYGNNKDSRFERALHQIHDEFFFVEDLPYIKLLDMAKQVLREQWNHWLVSTLVREMYFGFPDLRQFLKSKDKSLKLSGFSDLDKYDLSKVVTLEDFEGYDNILISHAIKPLNFRKVSFLKHVTDDQGRLRLTPEIKELTLQEVYRKEGGYAGLTWNVTRAGRKFRCCPDVGGEFNKRTKAKEFAMAWRTDDNEYCFETSMENITRMVDAHIVLPSFPGMNYREGEKNHPPSSSATISATRIPIYQVGKIPTEKLAGENIKGILRHYGVPMTGNKEVLLEKLGRLTAEQYRKHLPAMDRYFRENRFIRVHQTPLRAESFPVLKDVEYIRNLLLSVYLLKHLRGNAIVEADFQNDTYSEEDASNALIGGRALVSGAFVKAG